MSYPPLLRRGLHATTNCHRHRQRGLPPGGEIAAVARLVFGKDELTREGVFLCLLDNTSATSEMRIIETYVDFWGASQILYPTGVLSVPCEQVKGLIADRKPDLNRTGKTGYTTSSGQITIVEANKLSQLKHHHALFSEIELQDSCRRGTRSPKLHRSGNGRRRFRAGNLAEAKTKKETFGGGGKQDDVSDALRFGVLQYSLHEDLTKTTAAFACVHRDRAQNAVLSIFL